MKYALVFSSDLKNREIYTFISDLGYSLSFEENMPEDLEERKEDFEAAFLDINFLKSFSGKTELLIKSLNLKNIPSILVLDEIEYPNPDKETNFYSCDSFVTTPARKNMVGLSLYSAVKIRKLKLQAQNLRNTLFEETTSKSGVDSKTGLYVFNDNLDLIVRELNLARRYKNKLTIGLSKFYEKNDSLDEILENEILYHQLQYLLRRVSRDIDLVISMDRNLFMFILPYTDKTGAQRLFERIQVKLDSINIENFKLGLRFGASVYLGVGQVKFEDIISESRAALITAEDSELDFQINSFGER